VLLSYMDDELEQLLPRPTCGLSIAAATGDACWAARLWGAAPGGDRIPDPAERPGAAGARWLICPPVAPRTTRPRRPATTSRGTRSRNDPITARRVCRGECWARGPGRISRRPRPGSW